MKQTAFPRELRVALWVTLLSAPLMWSAAAAAPSRAEAVDYALAVLFLGALPSLAVALFWPSAPPTVDPLLRYGQSRRTYVLVSLAQKAITLLATVLLLSTVAFVDLYEDDPGALWSDIASTLPICVATSIALAASFGCARAWFGKLGLVIALFVSWFVSAQEGLALLLPLSHVRGLLLLSPRPSLSGFEFAGWMSLGALYGLSALFLGLLMVRMPR